MRDRILGNMATLQDLKAIFQDQVHKFAGDAHLEEMCNTLDAIEHLVQQEERERIVSLLDWLHNDSNYALCKDYHGDEDGEEHAMDTPEIRAFLQPGNQSAGPVDNNEKVSQASLRDWLHNDSKESEFNTVGAKLADVHLNMPAVERVRLIVELKNAAKGTDAECQNAPTNEQLAILELAKVLNALVLKNC